MQVEFIKERFFNNKKYEVGEIVEMQPTLYKVYKNQKAVKPYHKIKSLDDLSYKELQQKCKNKNLPAVGTKESLLLSLKGNNGDDK